MKRHPSAYVSAILKYYETPEGRRELDEAIAGNGPIESPEEVRAKLAPYL